MHNVPNINKIGAAKLPNIIKKFRGPEAARGSEGGGSILASSLDMICVFFVASEFSGNYLCLWFLLRPEIWRTPWKSISCHMRRAFSRKIRQPHLAPLAQIAARL